MRFLVDAQLPPALARWLAAQGHEAEHVSDCGLAQAADPAVWDYATGGVAPCPNSLNANHLRSALAYHIYHIICLRRSVLKSMIYPHRSIANFYMLRHIMNYASEHVIAALKAGRKEKRLTQRRLSAQAGVPQSHISKIESGAVDIKLSSLIELARVLGLELILAPRKLLPAVQAVLRSGEAGHRTPEKAGAPRPAYSLDEDADA
jgi:transcriptional regulator with XRE-family HTH domain